MYLAIKLFVSAEPLVFKVVSPLCLVASVAPVNVAVEALDEVVVLVLQRLAAEAAVEMGLVIKDVFGT